MGKGRAGTTYAALQGATIDIVPIKLTNGHSRVLVSVHLDERETTVRLETGLHHITEVLEQGDEVLLGSVWGQVANIACRLPSWGLVDDHVIAVHTVSREVVMTIWRRRCQAHLLHSRLLGNRWLALLVGPVATDSTRSEPLAIHRAQGFLSIWSFAEGDEAVTTRPTSLHIPHNPSLGNGPEGRECLQKHLIVDFVGQITDEDVEVVRGILFVVGIGLVGPVDTDFLAKLSVVRSAASRVAAQELTD